MQGYNTLAYSHKLVGAFTVTMDFADVPIVYGVNPGPFSDLPGKTVHLGGVSGGATAGTAVASWYTYTFMASDFADPHNATCTEVAAALTAWAATCAYISGGSITTTGATSATVGAGNMRLAITGATDTTGLTLAVGTGGTAHDDLGLISGLYMSPTGQLTGTSIVFSSARYPGIDWWSWQPDIKYSVINPGTWVRTYGIESLPGASGSAVAACKITSVSVTPSATGATLLFAGTSGGVQTILCNITW